MARHAWVLLYFITVVSCSLFTISSTHPGGDRIRRSHGPGNSILHAIDKAANENEITIPAVATHQEKNLPEHIVISPKFHEDVSSQLSDLQSKFEELSRQHSVLQQELTDRINKEKRLDGLVTKLEKVLGVVNDHGVPFRVEDPNIAGNVNMDRRIETLSEFLGNREAELVGYVPTRLTSNVSSTIGELRKELPGAAQKTLDLLEKSLVQLNERTGSLESYITDIKAQITRGGQANGLKEEFQNGSANTIKKRVMPARVLSAASSLPTVHPTEVDATRKIAFSVAATRPQLGTEGAAQTVAFQDVMENANGDYLSSNHTFICSVPGWYYFTFSLRTSDNMYLGVLLMKNDNYLVSVYTDASDRNTMETQSTVVKLQAGDAVWLRLAPSSKYGLYSDTYRYSTFSGFLLFKE